MIIKVKVFNSLIAVGVLYRNDHLTTHTRIHTQVSERNGGSGEGGG